MNELEEKYKNNIGVLLAMIMNGLKRHRASDETLDEFSEILATLTTTCFEYGLYMAEKQELDVVTRS